MTVMVKPLSGEEIKKGIAIRMTQDLPGNVREALQEQIVAWLGKTCSFLPSAAYAKFKATWKLHWWYTSQETRSNWWVSYELDDFGRVTSGGIGDSRFTPPMEALFSQGAIDETPPDRFRRETDQPIPKPVELKPTGQESSSFSKSLRGSGRRRQV